MPSMKSSSALQQPKSVASISCWDSLPPGCCLSETSKSLPRAAKLQNQESIRHCLDASSGQLSAMLEIVEGLKKDIVKDLESIMQRELDNNLKKIETLVKNISLAGVSDVDLDFVAKSQRSARSSDRGTCVSALGDTSESVFEVKGSLEATLLGEVKQLKEAIILDAQKFEDVMTSDATNQSVVWSPKRYVPKRNVFSRSGSALSISKISEVHGENALQYDAIIDAVVNGPIETLTRYLEKDKLDPNLHLRDITINDKSFTHCSLLAAAVLGQQQAHVNLLSKFKADIESTYGFVAGIGMPWSGPAAVATVVNDDAPMLKLLLGLRADPDTEASNGANLIWQCAYFGKHNMLQFLLSIDLSAEALSRKAEYQNDLGVTYSPLHISVVMGQEQCSHLLVAANAPIDTRNEHNQSPLDTAIKNCRPELVTFLVQEGADVVHAHKMKRESGAQECKSIGQIMQMVIPKERSPVMAESTTEIGAGRDAFELLFHKPNPVLVHALAVGLQSQPGQVEVLTPAQILDLCKTDTDSMIAMLEALFVERKIRYRAKDAKKGIRERKTAVVRRSEQLPGTDQVYKYPIVVSSAYAYSDLMRLEVSGKYFDEHLSKFIDDLAPQRHDAHECFPKARVHAPIVVYECLVPAIHRDLRFLKLVADAGELSSIFLNPHCQAIITYAWSRARKMAIMHCFAHFMMLMFFAFVVVRQNYRDEDEPDFADANIAAIVVLPFWLFEVVAELIEFAVHLEYGWTRDYLTDFQNIMDLFRDVADGMVIFSFLIGGIDVMDPLYFRCFIAGVCMFKWTKMLYCLTSFRTFGLPVLPILFALRHIGSSVAIMFVYFSGMAHGLVALNLLPTHFSFTILRAFMFGVGGDTSLVDPHEGEDLDGWWFKLILVIALFLAPVTFMNIFIAAMSSSYAQGITCAEQLYQNRCVEGTFYHGCVQYALGKSFVSSRTRGCRLWYCRDSSE